MGGTQILAGTGLLVAHASEFSYESRRSRQDTSVCRLLSKDLPKLLYGGFAFKNEPPYWMTDGTESDWKRWWSVKFFCTPHAKQVISKGRSSIYVQRLATNWYTSVAWFKLVALLWWLGMLEFGKSIVRRWRTDVHNFVPLGYLLAYSNLSSVR